MEVKTLSEINEKYGLEMERVVETIKKEKAEKVLLQFPEGMKPYAQAICDEVQEKADTQCFIWLGTCFGACDVPMDVERLGVDLIVQFGHSDWGYSKVKDIQVV